MAADRPLWQHDATELAAAIASGARSATEVVTSVAERIRALNPAINALVPELTDDALEQAARADATAARARAAGEPLPPLHGVPVTIKINVDVEGQPTTNGLPALANAIAPGDSAVVANLRRAGAIIVGRSNAPELSMRITTDNPLHGRTINPWGPDASVGGSSGGAGAAAAAGFGAIHHGNDIGGSLRAPAFCNGVVTIKPTQGRIPAYNPSATAERGLLSTLMSTQGTIARSVADVRLGTRVMAEGDPRDPWWVPAPFDGPELGRPIRVAVTRNAHGGTIHPGIASLIDRSAGFLSDAGYDVVEVEPPAIIDAAREWFRSGITELKLTLDDVVRAHGSRDLITAFDSYYERGELLDLAGYRAGLSERTGLQRRWTVFLAEHPLVLCPYLLQPTYAWDADVRSPESARSLFDAAIYSFGFNLLGLPAGVLPVDLVEGLPAGVQLVGPRYREDVVLDAMGAIEARTGRMVEQLWARA